jgi:glycerophosphoryl diester phosphodiesterase
MSDFILIAHRGFSSKAPENTIAAFDRALDSGFTNVELDVQLTADGIPVVIHDGMIDRTTNGTGPVASMTYAQLAKLDAGSWFDRNFAGEKVPLLEAVLKRYVGKIHLHLELKSEQPDLARRVAALLKSCHWLDESHTPPFAVPGLTITSKYLDQLDRSLKLLPAIDHHWLTWDLNEQIVETAMKKGFKGLGIEPKAAEPNLVKEAQNKGLTVRGLVAKSDDDIRTFIAAGVEGTTTNWPDRGVTIKKELAV